MFGVNEVSRRGLFVIGLVYFPHKNHSFIAAFSYVNPSENKILTRISNTFYYDLCLYCLPEHWTGSFIISCVIGHKNS